MASSVPAVIPAFKTLAAAALPAGSEIWLGAVLPVYQVGPGAVSGVATGIICQLSGIRFDEDAYAELGPSYRHEEHYNISGCLISWSGGTTGTFDQCLQDAYTCYEALAVAVANNPTLGLPTPAPRLVWMRQLSVIIAPDSGGFAQAQIEWEAQVQARVTSLT